MIKFKVKGIEFQVTGTRFEEINEEKVWFHDIKNLKTGKHKLNVSDETLQKYLKK